MSPGARSAALMVGGAMAFGGLALSAVTPGGLWLVAMGGLVIASVLWEGRYRTSGGQGGSHPGRWQLTGEREIDSETGDPIEVWFDPQTGARRYLRSGERPE